MPRWLKVVLFVLLLLIASIPLAMQFETGSIEGSITDDLGPVANASVDARNVMTGAVGRAQSDAGGAYVVDNLRAGRYSLWIQAPGHDPIWLHGVIVERNQAARQDVHLTRTQTVTPGL
jgi:hypothetical protein